jgi:hypothetical protein
MPFYKSENTENRELAELPSVSEDNFGEKFDNYISDNFAFRNVLVNTDSKIKASVFGLSGNESVTVGKDGWLFFTETLDDVMSRNTMTDREIFCASRTLEMLSEYVEDNGGRFVFVTAPNKASLYDEYLPYYYSKSNVPNNYDNLLSKLNNVDYIDLRELFEEQDEVLYHRLDSHWNNKGAVLVVNCLLEHLGLDAKTYGTPEERNDWDGDLYKMLFPTMQEKDTQYYYDDYEFNYIYTKRFKSVDDMTISTENKLSENGNILLFRDSFGRSMLPFVGESFSKAVLSRSVPYDFRQIENNDFDYVVLEVVERNLDNLISKAPYMTAKSIDVDYDKLEKIDSKDYTVTVENDGLNHIYGNMLESIPTEAKIYVEVGGSMFEAFPCYELDEYEESDGRGNGFSLYTEKTGDINIYISEER